MDAKISAMGDRIKVPLFANALIFCDWRAQESSVIGEGEKKFREGRVRKAPSWVLAPKICPR